jgi:hypothetical protein
MNDEQNKRLTGFLSLRQRYRWSVVLYEPLKPLIDRELRGQPLSAKETQHADALANFWLASLWVLVEGWNMLGLSQASVDSCLADPHCTTLKQFRNFVFEFESEYVDPRESQLHAGRKKTIAWANELVSAFKGVLRPRNDDPEMRLIMRWVLTGDGKLGIA